MFRLCLFLLLLGIDAFAASNISTVLVVVAAPVVVLALVVVVIVVLAAAGAAGGGVVVGVVVVVVVVVVVAVARRSPFSRLSPCFFQCIVPTLKCDVPLWRGQGFYSLLIMRAIVGVGVAGTEYTEISVQVSVSSGLLHC